MRAEDAQGTPTQSHISPSIHVYEDKPCVPGGQTAVRGAYAVQTGYGCGKCRILRVERASGVEFYGCKGASGVEFCGCKGASGVEYCGYKGASGDEFAGFS